MKKTFLTAALVVVMTATGFAQSSVVKVGIILGFTGPIESLTQDMAPGAELAFKEASDSGLFLGGKRIKVIRGDSTCVDAAAATAVAERLVTSDKVVAIMGAACSGATTAVVNNVSVPNGVVTISPSATSPALSTIKDKGYFFRTAPSDARQGQVLAQVAIDRGIKKIAVTFTNNDYGKGLADSFVSGFKKLGGKVTINAPHEDGKADYSAEVGALAASGADELAVLGYVDQGGLGIIQASLDAGAFKRFVVGDGMIGQSIIDRIGDDMIGTFGTLPGGVSEGRAKFVQMATKAGINGEGPYVTTSYDAAALIVLAMQAAGSTNRSAIRSKVMMVANAPGEKILPGELAKGLKILKAGGDVDYVGASSVEFNDVGEVFGTYREMEIKKSFQLIQVR
ncbi:MAG: ABC transporter substrate-binding protein [Deltaproteobacteria bacterium]|nr:ABC transporter substrate-binding protein [Deltaproteobacteria bacterium]MBT4088075.1 ABC transporter substrate-binding protein [Deltaproteobacteria bacterium]MBT4265914.1 ABC transporter substrate-binding protein [Deltaproteobacteria bacterium]MBT4641605.1 ABC transporter substrate-binding protein [Deltaproteobacteria bacterium]MBT6503158.1 ABC transporter substrate-binding protein [Deltaproteobacteria bacterium]